MDKFLNANIILSKFSMDYMELKKDLPIRPSEMAVVNIITKRDGKFTPVMIAELLGVSKPMVTSHIVVLEKKGYVEKEYLAEDRRSFYILPTKKAKELSDNTDAKFSVYLKNLEKDLGEENFDMLINLIDKTSQILRNCKSVNNGEPK